MGRTSTIEWTDSTWNPVAGCSPVSPGCANCYAARLAHRFNTPSPKSPYRGMTRIQFNHAGKRSVLWTGDVRVSESQLHTPFGWRMPRRVFVCSMGDLFHTNVTNEFIAHVFAVMRLCQQHTFMVLTKRADRMLEWFQWASKQGEARGKHAPSPNWTELALHEYLLPGCAPHMRNWKGALGARWPLQNVWLGVSVENQVMAEQRIPPLLQCPAATRFVSCEPLLAPVDLTRIEGIDALVPQAGSRRSLNWVIAGGESGPGARPMDLDWARSLRDQCVAAGVPYFFKHVGGVQKGPYGRDLDGRTWDDAP